MHGIWNLSNIMSHFFLVFLCEFFNVEKDRDAKQSSLVLHDSLGVKCRKKTDTESEEL